MTLSRAEKWLLDIATFIKQKKKIFNILECVEVRILVEKWNRYEEHIFRNSLVQTCWMETTSSCLNIRLILNKNFQTLIIFIEIKVTVSLLDNQHLMTSIIFRTRSLTLKKKPFTYLVFMFQQMCIFRIWGVEEHVFHITSFRPTSYVIKIFGCFDVSKRVSNWNKIKIHIYVGFIFQIYYSEIPIFIY